ncbi:MAG: formimidoylglutamate deiminase [Bacteroidota bacterium]
METAPVHQPQGKHWKFAGLLQADRWITPAYVETDEKGRINRISQVARPEITYEELPGYVLPGLPNAHSHAFQYAMAGLSERHAPGAEADDFWSWRQAMYRLALHVDPEQMYAIARMLYMEMLSHGYTSVAEFHYLHHDQDGQPYAQLAQMGESLVAAAEEVGLRITLIPIFYQKGGFGQKPSPGQRRFISQDLEAYLRLVESSQEVCRRYELAQLGYGGHSLRAVEPKILPEFLSHIPTDYPFHLHISEQKKEIQGSMAYLGRRPVEWLLDCCEIGENVHLVHATHLTDQETRDLAQSKARVVLCPTTEGNLGDGRFPLQKFQAQGGKWSIGTDSHIGLNPFEELRLLDYAQRLHSHQRNIYRDEGEANSGQYALRQMVTHGREAMGPSQAEFFPVGAPFDAVVINALHPLIQTTSQDHLLNTIVYACDRQMVYGTLTQGIWRIKAGQHPRKTAVHEDFVYHLNRLKNR